MDRQIATQQGEETENKRSIKTGHTLTTSNQSLLQQRQIIYSTNLLEGLHSRRVEAN